MDDVERSSFAARLKRCRLFAELTQEELAQRAGLSARAISALERGVNQRPHRQTVQLLAKGLGLGAEEREHFEAEARRLPQHKIAASSSEPMMAWQRLHAGPLAGRANEMALVQRHLRGKGPPVLLIAGEPGIGKSRLLKEGGQLGREYGLTVLYGGCQRRKGQEPYSPVVMALARYVQRRPRVDVRTAMRGCESLVRLLPEAAELVGNPSPATVTAPDQERRVLYDAVVRFLGNVVGPAGTLLLLDDLQWAGRDALDLLASIAACAEEVPLRVIATYRHTELPPDHALNAGIAELAQRDCATHMVLSPLAPDEANDLLTGLLQRDGEFSRDVLSGIVSRAEGVPFFLVNSLQALRAGALEESVPWNIRESILHRVRIVSIVAQDVLGVAATAGRSMDRALLIHMSSQPEERVVAALEELCRAGLLLENGEHGYRFAHDVVREVVEESLGTARQALLHRQIADALEGSGAQRRGAELAWHYSLAGEPNHALRYAIQAGDQAEDVFAHNEAERHYRMALELLQQSGALRTDRLPVEAEILRKLGDVLIAVARYSEALQTLERAASTCREIGDTSGLARTSLKVAQAHAFRGTPEEGIGRIRALLGPMEEAGPSLELASFYVEMARLYFFTGQYDSQATAAGRAVELANLFLDVPIRTEAWTLYGQARSLLGDMQEGASALEYALELSESEPVTPLPTQTVILGALSMMRLVEGRFDAAGSLAKRAVESAERRGDPGMIAIWKAALGLRAFLMGDWRQARNYYMQGVSLDRNVDPHSTSPYSLFCLGWLDLSEGHVNRAVQILDESIEMAQHTGNLQALRWATGIRAEADLSEGHGEAALSRLLPLLDRPGLEEWDVDLLLPRVAQAYAQLGDLERAESEATRAIDRARSRRERLPLGDALRSQARVLRCRGRTAEARSALDEALDVIKAMPYPYAEAQVLCDQAALRVDTADAWDARQLLEEARDIFRRLGAAKDVDRTQRALTRITERTTSHSAE